MIWIPRSSFVLCVWHEYLGPHLSCVYDLSTWVPICLVCIIGVLRSPFVLCVWSKYWGPHFVLCVWFEYRGTGLLIRILWLIKMKTWRLAVIYIFDLKAIPPQSDRTYQTEGVLLGPPSPPPTVFLPMKSLNWLISIPAEWGSVCCFSTASPTIRDLWDQFILHKLHLNHQCMPFCMVTFHITLN